MHGDVSSHQIVIDPTVSLQGKLLISSDPPYPEVDENGNIINFESFSEYTAPVEDAPVNRSNNDEPAATETKSNQSVVLSIPAYAKSNDSLSEQEVSSIKENTSAHSVEENIVPEFKKVIEDNPEDTTNELNEMVDELVRNGVITEESSLLSDDPEMVNSENESENAVQENINLSNFSNEMLPKDIESVEPVDMAINLDKVDVDDDEYHMDFEDTSNQPDQGADESTNLKMSKHDVDQKAPDEAVDLKAIDDDNEPNNFISASDDFSPSLPNEASKELD